MTGVRNGCLVRFRSSGPGFVDLVAVPAGETWLLKNVMAVSESDTAGEVFVQLVARDRSIVVQLVTFTIEASGNQTWDGWAGLNHGDLIRFWSNVAPVNIWISGAGLPGVQDEIQPTVVAALPA
jgi:hypothetical protein